ncbi:MAG: HAMP domain-containing sensor histidine kinase [Lachnospiraceae bacterium]|nr:HAMP domain-containing sensor histidine kinase [Lachnospiraceae bacterium]
MKEKAYIRYVYIAGSILCTIVGIMSVVKQWKEIGCLAFLLLELLVLWVHFREHFLEKRRRKEEAVQESQDRKEICQIREDMAKIRVQQAEESKWLRSMLSHNVRMPMSVIAGYGDLLRRGRIMDEGRKKVCLEKITGNIIYLSNIISLLLDGNQENYKILPEGNSCVNLTAAVYEVCGYMKDMAEKNHVRLQVNCTRPRIIIMADYTQIMRVFYNLYENSFKYMKKDGSICITLDIAESEVIVVYKDDGCGMKEEEAANIFQKHYQGSNHTYGTGMGMYFVKEVIAHYGGTIYAKSNINQGMSIYMTFPLAEE